MIELSLRGLSGAVLRAGFMLLALGAGIPRAAHGQVDAAAPGTAPQPSPELAPQQPAEASAAAPVEEREVETPPQAATTSTTATATTTTQANHATPTTAATATAATPPLDSDRSAVDRYLKARCRSALCVGEDNWIGIEPLVELPVGKAFALGTPSFADHINNHGFRVELTAGLRVWVFRDLISFSIYLSTPLSDETVRLDGIDATFPGSAIHRPYPGVAVGLLYDFLWIGFDHDQLRNGDGSQNSGYTPLYPPNAVISSTTVVTFAIQPITAVRTLLGAVAND